MYKNSPYIVTHVGKRYCNENEKKGKAAGMDNVFCEHLQYDQFAYYYIMQAVQYVRCQWMCL